MMTAVICWSIKMRMVQSKAGITAAITVHHGFGPTGVTNQPRSSRVGWENKRMHIVINRINEYLVKLYPTDATRKTLLINEFAESAVINNTDVYKAFTRYRHHSKCFRYF